MTFFSPEFFLSLFEQLAKASGGAIKITVLTSAPMEMDCSEEAASEAVRRLDWVEWEARTLLLGVRTGGLSMQQVFSLVEQRLSKRVRKPN